MHAEQGRELLVELLHVRLQEVQFRERHREQPAVEGRHIRRGPEGIAQLLRRGMQPGTAECGDRGRIGLARGDGAEHAPRTRAEQVRHQRGHLDVRFLEEGLEAILQLHAIPRQLILAPGHRAPQTLRDVWHKAEGQLVRDQPFHQALGIREISLPAGRP